MRIPFVICIALVLTLPAHWAGAAYTITDLTPTATDASAGDVFAWQQVGTNYTAGTHAVLFRGTPASAVDLHPAGFVMSFGFGTNGTVQVGAGRPTSETSHALLWHGTAASVVDLNPFGSVFSEALDANGDQQVGYFRTGSTHHAVLWTGTAASAVDLNAAPYVLSFANGGSGTQQVGDGYTETSVGPRALLWSGTAASVVDLTPNGYTAASGRDAAGNQQVGFAYLPVVNNVFHAMMWTGTAASAVDLNPAGWTYGEAFGTNGTSQVGYVGTGTTYRAVLWNGSADSMMFLPSVPGFSNSIAEGIDVDGAVFGAAFNDTSHRHLVVWKVPEPGSVSAVLFVAMALAARKRSRR